MTYHNSIHFTSKVLFETKQEPKMHLFMHCLINQIKVLGLFNAKKLLIKTDKANISWRYTSVALSNLIDLGNID